MVVFQVRGLGQEVMSLLSQRVGNAGEKAWNGKKNAREQVAELGKLAVLKRRQCSKVSQGFKQVQAPPKTAVFP